MILPDSDRISEEMRQIRIIMSDNRIMRGNEFIQKVKKLAKKRGIESRVDKKRGLWLSCNSLFW
ncbi:hypothetical protein H1P_2130004 [Hyella patelloides LEGE 07179]|uniref:Uncharacterized protein n=1 Tax=Hyella patelloides LEGE 07179 TaxID=945734 RepID=A0A563VQN1_9CYAN|nr:hypothetical protein H1P_2130004 [Hyella patelloides LEGE 07179]